MTQITPPLSPNLADRRPYECDIGDGTTITAVKLGQKSWQLHYGYVQLAGGTNKYT